MYEFHVELGMLLVTRVYSLGLVLVVCYGQKLDRTFFDHVDYRLKLTCFCLGAMGMACQIMLKPELVVV